jgi:predicted outer membrane protein
MEHIETLQAARESCGCLIEAGRTFDPAYRESKQLSSLLLKKLRQRLLARYSTPQILTPRMAEELIDLRL